MKTYTFRHDRYTLIEKFVTSLYEVTRIPISVYDDHHQPVISTPNIRLCSDFHHLMPERKRTCKNTSSQQINQVLVQKQASHFLCPCGLIKIASPVYRGSHHIATVLVGPFYDTPPTPSDLLKAQARGAVYEYDITGYLRAISEVPVFSWYKIYNILSSITGLLSSDTDSSPAESSPAALHDILHSNRLSDTTAETVFSSCACKHRPEPPVDVCPGVDYIESDGISLPEEISANLAGLQESEEKYRALFNMSESAIFIFDHGTILDCNPAASVMFGYESKKTLMQQSMCSLSPEVQPNGQKSIDCLIELEKKVQHQRVFFEWHCQRLDGTLFDAEVNGISCILSGAARMVCIVRDITRHADLIREFKAQEKTLRSQADSLENANMALKAALEYREAEKRAIEEAFQKRLKQTVYPYLTELAQSNLTGAAETYLRLAESNLKSVTAPFAQTIFSKYLELTPTEIRVCDLIRDGHKTKDIAADLSLSPESVQWHRKNIRKKLKITNKGINLQTYLSNLTS